MHDILTLQFIQSPALSLWKANSQEKEIEFIYKSSFIRELCLTRELTLFKWLQISGPVIKSWSWKKIQAASILEMKESAALSTTSLHFPLLSISATFSVWMFVDWPNSHLSCVLGHLIIQLCLHGLAWVTSFRICQLPFWFFLLLLPPQLGHCEFAYGVTPYTHTHPQKSLCSCSPLCMNILHTKVYVYHCLTSRFCMVTYWAY